MVNYRHRVHFIYQVFIKDATQLTLEEKTNAWLDELSEDDEIVSITFAVSPDTVQWKGSMRVMIHYLEWIGESNGSDED